MHRIDPNVLKRLLEDRGLDCQEIERELKRFLERIWRACGKLLIVKSGQIVTAYNPSRKYERRLLRNAHECDLYE
jgi:hypothetical protein